MDSGGGVHPAYGWDDGSMDPPARPLTISPCRAECAWSTTGERLGSEQLFSCDGCGSEWVVSQAWTPVDWQGLVPDAVSRERDRQDPAGLAGPGDHLG